MPQNYGFPDVCTTGDIVFRSVSGVDIKLRRMFVVLVVPWSSLVPLAFFFRSKDPLLAQITQCGTLWGLTLSGRGDIALSLCADDISTFLPDQ